MRREGPQGTHRARRAAGRSRVASRAVRGGPGVFALAGASLLAGCIELGGAGGVTAHGGGPVLVEESVRLGFAVPPRTSPRENASGGEFGAEVGFGQRLDAPGKSLRLGLFVDARLYPAALTAGDVLRAFPTFGASLEGMEVEGYRLQIGLLARAGFGLRFALHDRVGTSAILESQGGFLATVRPENARPEPELPLALYGGVRLRLSFDFMLLERAL